MRTPHLVALLLICAGCAPAPSLEDVQAAFEETVADSNACEVDADCAIASSECPLGCWVAVRTDRVEAVEQRAAELVTDYEGGGGPRCEYDCAAPGPPMCVAGRCAADPE